MWGDSRAPELMTESFKEEAAERAGERHIELVKKRHSDRLGTQ